MMSTTETELDVEESHDKEDGELEDSDVEDGSYIPLTRPETFDPPSLVRMQIQDEHSDSSLGESSGSESDEEPQRRPKRSKLKPRHQQPVSSTDSKSKHNNIWAKTLQEQLLTDDMVTCDVSKKFRYGVESYDYTIKYRLGDNIPKNVFTQKKDVSNRTSNKRRNMDRSNVKLRLGKRINSNHQKEVKSIPKTLENLTVTADESVEIIAADIAKKLSEEKIELLGRIVQVLGRQKTIEIYKQTQQIEADGGMLVMNGTRRRTSGGVFFFLLKHDDGVSQDMLNQIFNEDKKETIRKIKQARAKSRQKVMEQLKQSLTDSELPSLLSRGEATAQTEHGSNPPPSPATDARECSSDTDAHSHSEAPAHSPPRPLSPLPERTESRQVQNYDDDDFLEVMCNEDMDLF